MQIIKEWKNVGLYLEVNHPLQVWGADIRAWLMMYRDVSKRRGMAHAHTQVRRKCMFQNRKAKFHSEEISRTT